MGCTAIVVRPPPWRPPVLPELFRALLREAHRRGREVIAPTVVCAEVARGPKRTRALEAAVSRHDRRRGEQPALRLVDAHVVAACVAAGGGLVVTTDPDDITALAAAFPPCGSGSPRSGEDTPQQGLTPSGNVGDQKRSSSSSILLRA